MVPARKFTLLTINVFRCLGPPDASGEFAAKTIKLFYLVVLDSTQSKSCCGYGEVRMPSRIKENVHFVREAVYRL